MISYNTFSTTTAILGVLFYVFVRNNPIEYGIDDTRVDIPCERAFQRLSNIHFFQEINERYNKVELLLHTDDEETTTYLFRVHEEVPYIGEIRYENLMRSFQSNRTVTQSADIWYGYMKFRGMWTFKETTIADQCKISTKQVIYMPLVLKYFTEKHSREVHEQSVENMKLLLNQEI